jgi:hypothetical protein
MSKRAAWVALAELRVASQAEGGGVTDGAF